MKVLIVGVAIVFSILPLTVPQKRPSTTNHEGAAGKNVRRQIGIMEKQLKQALTKCDVSALNRLLADYYADAFGENERAVGKKRTIDRCAQRGTPYYEIVEHKKVTVQGELAVITGVGKAPPPLRQTDLDVAERDSEVRIERTWTNNAGRWILTGQWIRPAEEPERK